MQLQEFGWGWYVITYFFIGGIAAGAYFTATLAEIFGGPEDRPMAKVGYYLSFPLILVCALLLIVDLGNPTRFWHIMVNEWWGNNVAENWSRFAFNLKFISPMNIGGWALAGFGFFNLLSILDVWVEEGRLISRVAPLKAFYSAVPRKLYAAAGCFFGFFVAGYTGVLMNVTAQPLWAESNWLGALFIASAASTGAATIGLIMAIRNRKDDDEAATRLARMDNAAIIIEVAILIILLATAPLLAQILLMTGGIFAGLFWLFVFLGIVIPLALQGRTSMGGGHLPRNLAVLTALLILIGGFIMRYMVVMVQQS
jgi:formate-dependent nitrite reductase membrane component NrfD